jgi:dihydrofolate reductase
MTKWPSGYSDEIFARPMNEIPKAVFTRKGVDLSNGVTTAALKNASAAKKERGLVTVEADLSSWKNAEIIKGDLKTGIERLKQQNGKPILAHGGASFARSLVQTGLIDEYRLVVHPFALGKGLPLFSALDDPMPLELMSLIPFRSGVIALTYQPLEK